MLAALIVIVPCFVFWKDLDQGQVYGLYLGAFVYLALGILLLNLWLGLFLLYVAGWFGYWISGHFVNLVDGSAILAGVDAILFLICASIVYEGIVKSSLKDETIITGICIAALFQAILAIIQYHGFDPPGWALSQVVEISYGEYDPTTPAGTLANTNYMGAFLGISLWFFFRMRWWSIVSIPVIIYALILANCRTADIAVLGVGTFFVCWYGTQLAKYLYGRYVGWALTLVTILSFITVAYLIASLNWGSLIVRYHEFWYGPIHTWLGSWQTFIFGVGPGITQRINNYLHNEEVVWVWNYGLLGTMLILGFIGTTLAKLTIAQRTTMITCSIVVALIDMQANHLLHIPTTGLLMIVIAGLAQRHCKDVSLAEAWIRWRLRGASAQKPPLGYHPVYAPRPWWWVAGYAFRKAAWSADNTLLNYLQARKTA